MPHACKIGKPVCSRYPSLNAFGTAEPPHGIARNEDVSRPFNSGNTAIQMVGTPAATVTFSSTIKLAIALPDKSGPGITSVAPAATAASKVNADMQLSEHFNLKEFTKSETAIRKRIDNTPNAEHAKNLQNVCEKILEPVRKHFGKPVRINSGYRGPALNAAVGGSSKSQHCNGEAIDFEIDGLPNPTLAKWVAENCEFDQIILHTCTNL